MFPMASILRYLVLINYSIKNNSIKKNQYANILILIDLWSVKIHINTHGGHWSVS